MGKKRIIDVAAREKRRMVNEAVGRSFLKTITEPVTNSDSSLKNRAGVSHAAGLVERMLALEQNERLNTAELKKDIPKTSQRRIRVEISTAGQHVRLCRVIDTGTGMTLAELEKYFGTYASAKAKGQKTRSLFGRGALDVLLYHDNSEIFSVKDGRLAQCKIYWEEDTIYETDDLGPVTKELLAEHDLPTEIVNSGTVVKFRIKEGTSIPLENQIIAKISEFYMLRLIAADPNTNVTIQRQRANEKYTDSLSYDFPIGTVVGRFTTSLDVGFGQDLKVDILVARSEVPLEMNPTNIEHRQSGLLFVDDNDAVFDLTLLPEYDKNPFLKHLFGIVRIDGIRRVLEERLESVDAEAVLTTTRDGFNQKSEITKRLFKLVETFVKPIYQKEEQQQKKGDPTRSADLDKRVREALKLLNQFNADQTDAEGTGELPTTERDEPLFFAVSTLRLHAGVPRRVWVFVNAKKVKDEETILWETTNPELKVQPESAVVKFGRAHLAKLDVTLSSDVKHQRGTLRAITQDKEGKVHTAEVIVTGVDDPPVVRVPEDIEFTASRFSGEPLRDNRAALLVNLTAFPGKPEVTFWLEERVGSLGLNGGADRQQIKVQSEDLISGKSLARITIIFRSSGWGSHAVLHAKAKRADGKVAFAKCRLKIERDVGENRFSNFHYEDLGRPVLGDVAVDKLYINAGYSFHKQVFGATEEAFNKRLESDPIAQLRAAEVLVQTVVHHAAMESYREGGRKGIQVVPEDPVTSVRSYIEQRRMELEPRVIRALAPDLPVGVEGN